MGELQTLKKGANLALGEVVGDHRQLVVVIETTAIGDPVAADASILLLGPDRKARSNEDLIFYNQPSGADGAVRLYSLNDDEAGGEGIRRDAIDVDLQQVPPTVEQIVIAASTDDPEANFGQAASVRMWVARADDPMTAAVSYEIEALTVERALIFGELYRRDGQWKVRAVGQGYRDGLAALVTDFGIEVDDPGEVDAPADEEVDVEKAAQPVDDQPMPLSEAAAEPEAQFDEVPAPKVAIARRRRAARLAADWQQRTSPYLPVAEPGPWRRASLFPTVGIKTAAEQEVRSTAVTLSVIELVREFGRAVLSLIGAPGGRIETFTEVRFNHGGSDVRPDGLIRVTRGSKVWHALIEVKTAKARLGPDQVETYLALAKAKNFDAVVTISAELLPTTEESAVAVDMRKYKSVALRHLAWEQIIAEAAIAYSHTGIDDRTRARVMDEFLRYACEAQSGMAVFDDMGRHWVKAREAVKVRTIGANDAEAVEICRKFDQLSRHIALQLSALSGQRVVSVVPANHPDAVTRAKQLADSGELFGSLRVTGAAGLIVLNANLGTERIGCSLTTFAPRTGRPASKITWLAKQLSSSPDNVRITAHHAGSRTESTSALLGAVREDAAAVLPPNGKDIREFTVTLETSMGSKRAGSEGGFVTAMTKLANTFYVDVVCTVRNGREVDKS